MKLFLGKKYWIDLNRLKQYLFTISLVILLSGCSSFKGPLYPDIIYNNRQPLISVTYEYGEIQLILPLRYDAAVPDNDDATVATYSFQLDLNTSFTGEDSLDVSIDAGNAGIERACRRVIGATTYRRMQPFFLGLIAGQCLCMVLWVAIGTFTGQTNVTPFRF